MSVADFTIIWERIRQDMHYMVVNCKKGVVRIRQQRKVAPVQQIVKRYKKITKDICMEKLAPQMSKTEHMYYSMKE